MRISRIPNSPSRYDHLFNIIEECIAIFSLSTILCPCSFGSFSFFSSFLVVCPHGYMPVHFRRMFYMNFSCTHPTPRRRYAIDCSHGAICIPRYSEHSRKRSGRGCRQKTFGKNFRHTSPHIRRSRSMVPQYLLLFSRAASEQRPPPNRNTLIPIRLYQKSGSRQCFLRTHPCVPNLYTKYNEFFLKSPFKISLHSFIPTSLSAPKSMGHQWGTGSVRMKKPMMSSHFLVHPG